MPKRKIERTSSGRIKCTKKLKSVLTLNQNLLESLHEFQRNWAAKKSFIYPESGNFIDLFETPFQLCRIQNFLGNGDTFLPDLKDELDELHYTEKNNDLYHFHQSADLATIGTPLIRMICDFLYSDVLDWMRKATGLPLCSTVDVTVSRYEYNDYLLCHDDRCSSRKIAFILYLCKNWEKENGGTLDVFSTDENGEPQKIAHSFIPLWNSLIFFEVTKASYHQVAESLTEDRTRLTVAGWFHVEARDSSESDSDTESEIPESLVVPSSNLLWQTLPPQPSDINPHDWIANKYLDPVIQDKINSVIELKSEVGLYHILLPEKVQELEQALQSPEVEWSFIGPMHKRHYEVAQLNGLPPSEELSPLWQMQELMRSHRMFEILAKMTHLNIVAKPDGNEDYPPRAHIEIQRWSPGCYTLLHDQGENEPSLEVILTFHCDKDNYDKTGGVIYFVAHDTGEQLACANPISNYMAMVYADKHTVNFSKYVNHLLTTPFYIIRGTYYERTEQ